MDWTSMNVLQEGACLVETTVSPSFITESNLKFLRKGLLKHIDSLKVVLQLESQLSSWCLYHSSYKQKR